MAQQIDKQDTQPADCQEQADPEHDVSEYVEGPVINTAPSSINRLFHVTRYFNNDASRVLKRNDLFFNEAGNLQDKQTSRSS
jgi:hypothetical protein